jgi:cyclopropane fatty-acyl-phospholipid synthase-like methyltransferase
MNRFEKSKQWLKEMRGKYKYRMFVGPRYLYKKTGEIVLKHLIELGLKKDMSVLDVGCGSLSIGISLINYLDKNKYCGIEPEQWLIDCALGKEFDYDVQDKKNPRFDNNNEFKLNVFNGKKFDFIIISSVFIHATKKQIETCLDECKKVLKDDGKILLNYIKGKEDNKLTVWSYPQTAYYTTEYIENTLLSKGYDFKIVDVPEYKERQIWLIAQENNNADNSTAEECVDEPVDDSCYNDESQVQSGD